MSKFLDLVIDLDADWCIVTDLSSLSESAPRGVHDGAVPPDASYGRILDAWHTWVLNRLDGRFGVRASSTTDTLVVLLAAIQTHRSRPVQ